MKAHFHKVSIPPEHSFNIRHDQRKNFPKLWHYHPELEIQLTIRGEGVRFIGDNISNFVAGEIVFLGENLPHSWTSGEEYYADSSSLKVEAVIIQFRPDCLGRDFFQLPESNLVLKLFEKARRGMLFKGKARQLITKLMIESTAAKGMERLIILLKILKIMSETKEFETIASAHGFYKTNELESKRLNTIHNYAHSNYTKEISIRDIASVANLSETSFCRYFKTMTKKTFNNFLIEIRISHACRYLIEDKYPTDAICFKCGFNNLSNFYRHFKKIMGVTPFDYKRRYLQGPED